jgi:hypothetical protein
MNATRLWPALALATALFAACGGNDAPTASDPVPAGQSAQSTIGMAGGDVVLASSDGAIFALNVPAGALTKSTTVVLSTATATSAQHFNLHVEPQGVVLTGGLAATLTITLRTDAPLPAKGGLLYDGVPTPFSRLADGRLQVMLTHFAGTPPPPASSREQTQSARALAAPSASACSPKLSGADGSLTADDAVETELYGQCMVAAVNALAANAQYAAAVRLASATAAYLQAAGVGDAGGFIRQASGIACTAYRVALNTAQATPVTTMGTLYAMLRPILFWEGVRQGFGTTCASIGATEFMDVTDTKTSEAAAFYATQKSALTDTTSTQYAAAAQEASVAHDTVTQVRSLQPSPVVQTVLRTQIEQRAEPSLLDAMLQAPWQRCRDSGDYAELIRLMDLMDKPQAVKDAAQYCATQLLAQARDSSGAVTATLAPAQGGISAAQRSTTGALPVSRDSKLSLTGPIGALQCPADSSGGTESLLIKLDGTTVQTIAVAPYLQAQLDIAIQAALTAAGIADTAAQTTLTIERAGQPCDGYWGSNPAPLLSLSLDLGICAPNGTDAFCITPVKIASEANQYFILAMNVRGEVLLTRSYIDGRMSACSYVDNPQMQPCGAVWKNGVLRNLPDRFTPVGIADDGTVGGNQLEGTVGSQTLSHPAVAPGGSTTAIRLATSQGRSGTGTVDGHGKYLVSMSAGGRALYWTGDNGYSSTDLGFCSPSSAAFYCRQFTWYASTGPAWGSGIAIRSDSLPGSGTTFDIRQDGDTAGIVGQMVPYLGNGYGMKDFNQGALATLNLAVDSHGTILYNIADGSDVYGLTPASTAVPAGWQAYALGRAGDVVVCSAPDVNATRQMKLVNLYSGAATPAFSSASTFMSNGALINVILSDDLCGDLWASYKVVNGRILVRASSDADPTIIGAILTPRGVALP